MFSFSKNQILLITTILAVLSIGTYISLREKPPLPFVPPVVTEAEVKKEIKLTRKLLGTSVEGRKIEGYTYGDGSIHLLFIGGIHGGYEWNSVVLAYTLIDYLETHKETIPKNITIDIIPSLNPDGVFKVTGKEGRFSLEDVSTDKKILASGRFNANEVDLNRNFDCTWKPKSTWQSKIVSAGTAPFSEPEAKILKNFIQEESPTVVVFWHSQANGVYASQCGKGILPETLTVMNLYAKASGYPAVKSFDAYETTGAAEDWLASINIPAVTVELKTHTTIEWEQNLKGIEALINHYSQ